MNVSNFQLKWWVKKQEANTEVKHWDKCAIFIGFRPLRRLQSKTQILKYRCTEKKAIVVGQYSIV